jgi:sec-independent protein translocase protein TatA
MGDIGVPELLIILALIMIVVGPGKLSGLGGAIGKSIRELRHGLSDPPTIDGPPDRIE